MLRLVELASNDVSRKSNEDGSYLNPTRARQPGLNQSLKVESALNKLDNSFSFNIFCAELQFIASNIKVT